MTQGSPPAPQGLRTTALVAEALVNSVPRVRRAGARIDSMLSQKSTVVILSDTVLGIFTLI